MIKVSIIDDHKLFGICLKDYLSKQANINAVILEPDPVEWLLAELKNQKPHIAIVDLFMPKMTGDMLIRQLKQEVPEIKVIALSMCNELDRICSLIDIGIHSYISKADDPENLVKAIYAVSENKIYRTRLFTEALYWSTLRNTGRNNNNGQVLFNDREKKIIQLLWLEKSNKEIAAELFLGIRSIEKIRQEMKERLGVKTTIGLLKYALHLNIIQESNFPEDTPVKNAVGGLQFG
ncbi:MAG: response regulator transcription factor [Bacteroidetes bacterium]|nr:response regulator transcription factor [Bacteroidota bacterium]